MLSSTKALISSLLNSSTPNQSDELRRSSGGDSSPSVVSRAGILRLRRGSKELEKSDVDRLFDDAVLVGVSTTLLKRLSITSGSLILVKNVETKALRVGQAFVLDPPSIHGQLRDASSPSSPSSVLLFPSYNYPQNHFATSGQEVSYVSPLLAFNLGLHVSCLKSLVHQGKESLAFLFEDKMEKKANGKESEASTIHVRLEPYNGLPRYASHLRISFVKIPECGTLESLRGSSSTEAEDRQEMIDLALHNYFEKDRYLARGNIFCVYIKWNCGSVMCVSCSQKMQKSADDIIYFKVMSMEPSDEPLLRVNRIQTALVLGGNVSSAIPPELLVPRFRSFVPLQGDTVNILGSILAPPLCPSALSSKFRVAVLLSGLSGCGKRTVVKYVASRLGLHVVEYNCHVLTASSERKASVAIAEAFKAASRYSPAILLLCHFDAFRDVVSQMGSSLDQVGVNSEVASVIREFTEPVKEDEDDYDEEISDGDSKSYEMTTRHPLLLVAAADSSEGLPPAIRRCFTHEISMGPLTEEQRAEMLSNSLRPIAGLLPDDTSDDLVKDLVGQTSGFMPRDIRAIIADAGSTLIPKQNLQFEKDVRGKLIEDISPVLKTVQDGKPCDDVSKTPSKSYLAKALERSKKRTASALGTPKVPNIKWEDVGGLENVKKSILDTVQLPLLHKDLFSSGLRKRSGVLLYGPPGTGKTLLAKAVATECSLNFLSVKGPELINMYIGESEKNVRDIFQKARSARPCVIFFDELDSLAPARGASGDSGGVMDRVVSQMLAEIDGLNDSSQDLFIIGASNRPELIDPALLRPGRFDKLLYVGVSSDPTYRERVLKALTRKFKLHEDVSLYSIAKRCPPNFTGADMYALCADAWFHAAKRKVLDPSSDSNTGDKQAETVVVEYDDFVKVLGELSPSLSLAELRKYELLRDQFEGASNQA